LFLRFLGHTQIDVHTVGRSSLDEWSARRRGRDLHYTQQTQQTYTQAVSGIQTREPGNRAATDLRLWPHGRRRRFFLNATANVSCHQAKFCFCILISPFWRVDQALIFQNE
jgi:hypothetical protein